MRRRRTIALLTAASILAGCGASGTDETATSAPTSPEPVDAAAALDDTDVSAPTTAPTEPETPTSDPSEAAADAAESTVPSTSAPDTSVPDVGRVVVLAEEDVLADLLALGIPVVASSATVPTAGFQGMDGVDTSGIEIFDYLTISLESVAAMQADHLITWQIVVDQVGEDALAGTGAEVHVIPSGSSGRDQIRLLGDAFDRPEAAEQLVAELDAALETGRSQIPDGCAASVVAIYAGPNVAAFAGPVWDVPRSIDELGCELIPNVDEAPVDGNGRAWLSLEQLGLLDGPELIMLQTDSVDGERSSVDEIVDNPLWQQLPAVRSGDVTELDRLGYAGIEGEIRLVGELTEILGG
jgi:ABC-type Fe3+-hydroxamate transport system substrate-binding protein